jgi:hypothetical protein
MPPKDSATVVSLINRLRSPDELEAFREQIACDTVQAWNNLNALARYGYSDEVRLAATRLILEYGLGSPTAKLEIREARASAPTNAFEAAALSDDELAAYKLLEGRARRQEGDD